MVAEFDKETLDWLRTLPPRTAFGKAREALYRAGPVSSEDFVDIYEQLVRAGILTWEQVESYER